MVFDELEKVCLMQSSEPQYLVFGFGMYGQTLLQRIYNIYINIKRTEELMDTSVPQSVISLFCFDES